MSSDPKFVELRALTSLKCFYKVVESPKTARYSYVHFLEVGSTRLKNDGPKKCENHP